MNEADGEQTTPKRATVPKEKPEPPITIAETEPKTIEQLIYIGPNLPGGRLSGGTVFRGGVPAHLSDLVTTQPALSDLIVPVSDLQAASGKVNKPGTAEYDAYQALTALSR